MENSIRNDFNIPTEQKIKFEQYHAIVHNRLFFIIIPVDENEHSEIIERYEMAKYFHQQGEKLVPTFYPSIHGNFIGGKEGEYFILLQLNPVRKMNGRISGSQLAQFHLLGNRLTFSPRALKRVGFWKDIWQKRLEQMEAYCQTILRKGPSNSFEEILLEVLPYYTGLTENAIQYYVDTTMDETPQVMDYGTVCHERFHDGTWGREWYWKNPFDWVYDHYARDLAEWARSLFFQDSYYPQSIMRIFQEYQLIFNLSSFGWRMFYCRLIFPAHFFRTVEQYYLSNSHNRKNLEKEFFSMIHRSSEYEKLLANIFEICGVPKRTYQIPSLHWVQ